MNGGLTRWPLILHFERSVLGEGHDLLLEGPVFVLVDLLLVEVDGPQRLVDAGIVQAALQIREIKIVRIFHVLLCIIGAILLSGLATHRLRRRGRQRVRQIFVPFAQTGSPRGFVNLFPRNYW